MKKYPALSLIAVITALTLCGCGQETPGGTEKAKPNYKPLSDSSEAVKKAEPKDPRTSQKPPPVPTAKKTEPQNTSPVDKDPSIGKSASSVINYATGKTPLMIKQAQEKKLKTIQDSRNQSIEDTLKNTPE